MYGMMTIVFSIESSKKGIVYTQFTEKKPKEVKG